jgi:ribosomal protein L37AE/L43A
MEKKKLRKEIEAIHNVHGMSGIAVERILALFDVVKAKRTCAKCGSTDVIMFTADLDICNSCGCTQDGA